MLEAKYRGNPQYEAYHAARVLSFPFLRGFDSYVALREIVCFDSRRSDGLGRRLPRVLMSDFYKGELGSLARRQGDALNPIWWAVIAVVLDLAARDYMVRLATRIRCESAVICGLGGDLFSE